MARPRQEMPTASPATQMEMAADKGAAAAPAPAPVAEETFARRATSREVIYQAMMRGGTAFGAPFRNGVASLTQGVAQKLKQRGFFGFETFERSGEEPAPGANAADAQSPSAAASAPASNKFTRYGAALFRGAYRKPPP